MPALAPLTLALGLVWVAVPQHERHAPPQPHAIPHTTPHHAAGRHGAHPALTPRHEPRAPHSPHTPMHPHRGHAAPAKALPEGKAVDDEEIESLDAVETVDAGPVADGASAAGVDASAAGKTQAAGDKTDLHLRVVMGHLHAAVVHLPIAWLTLWSTFEAVALVWSHPWLVMAGLPMGVLTCVSFGPAVFTGLMRLEELADASRGYDVAAAHLHRNLLFVAWAAVVLACGLRLSVARPKRSKAARVSYVLLVWLAFALTGWSAHLGGCMVYGDDFLPF